MGLCTKRQRQLQSLRANKKQRLSFQVLEKENQGLMIEEGQEDEEEVEEEEEDWERYINLLEEYLIKHRSSLSLSVTKRFFCIQAYMAYRNSGINTVEASKLISIMARKEPSFSYSI